MRAEDTNTRAWQIYGRGQLDRACSPPLPDPLGGTPWDGIGPGAEVLGDVTGRRVRLLPLPGVSACPSAPPSWLAAHHGYVFDGCLVLGCRRTESAEGHHRSAERGMTCWGSAMALRHGRCRPWEPAVPPRPDEDLEIPFMRSTHRIPLILIAAAVTVLTGCAGQENHRPTDLEPTGGGAFDGGAGGEYGQPEPTPDVRIGATNRKMRQQSFHASGTTTAFPGATQETWWDPDHGLHMRVTGSMSGDVYCKDGTSYTSTPLFAAALAQRGQLIEVPDRLKDTFVTSEAGDCDMYYRIPDMVQAAPDKDRRVNGRQASAFETPTGSTQDVYFLEDGRLRLILVESTRAGRASTTTYDSYGKGFAFTMPAPAKTMTVAQLRAAAQG